MDYPLLIYYTYKMFKYILNAPWIHMFLKKHMVFQIFENALVPPSTILLEDVEYVLRKKYETLAENDNELVHPHKICGKCKERVSSAFEKDMVIPLEDFTFQEHSDNNCSLCDAYQSALYQRLLLRGVDQKEKHQVAVYQVRVKKLHDFCFTFMRVSNLQGALREKIWRQRKNPED